VTEINQTLKTFKDFNHVDLQRRNLNDQYRLFFLTIVLPCFHILKFRKYFQLCITFVNTSITNFFSLTLTCIFLSQPAY